MSVTILEALQNADYNLTNNPGGLGLVVARDQLHNAVGIARSCAKSRRSARRPC
jgi:hypothetical protein